MANQRAFLIDGTAFCYRAFHALPALTTRDGRQTNAVYGFATMLRALREREAPAYLAVAFDVGKPTFRHERFEGYKAQRPPMPESLIEQLPAIKTLLEAMRVPVFELEGFEAEGVLGTIARQLAAEGIEVCIVTGDKDVLQLIDGRVRVYNPHRPDGALIDAEAVRTRYGVDPEQIVDLLALMGDHIDNIPGVTGIGEKTAVELLQRFGTIDALYARLEELGRSARRSHLEQAKAQVDESRVLARIRTDVPIAVTPEALRAVEPDLPALRRMYADLEFKRLLKSLGEDADSAGPPCGWRLVDPGALAETLGRCEGPVAIEAWPLGERGMEAAFAAASGPDLGWVCALGRGDQDPGRARIAEWLRDPAAPKLAHDLKRVIRLLGRLGIAVAGSGGDTMLAAYLLHPTEAKPGLEDVARERLEWTLREPGELGTLSEDAAPGLAARACAVAAAHERLTDELHAQGLSGLYRELELPLIAVLAEMEADGVAVDVPYLAALSEEMGRKLEGLTARVTELAGGAVNPNSPKQLAQVLFVRLGLPVIKRTKTGPSTDSDVLRQLAGRHPLPGCLIEYRELAKLRSTYVDALPKLVDARSGRIHTSWNQTATATGRLSSSEPNLQNIPVKTELGRSIRRAFIAQEPGARLVSADYSQIELRILAHLSGDRRLCEAFHEGRDIHRFTASLIYGVAESDVSPEQRQAMKAVNFGILYGMTAHGLARELGGEVRDAQAFIDAYFERYPGVRAYRDGQLERARRDGYVSTLWGRRRPVPELKSSDGAVRQFGERMALNAPVQGTAADLIKRAMIDLAEALRAERLASRLVLQVHDELVMEGPESELPRLPGLLRSVMERAGRLAVPLAVTVKQGRNWLEQAGVPD
ncbi:MAG TPA: DNA polymerase I [bacterium]